MRPTLALVLPVGSLKLDLEETENTSTIKLSNSMIMQKRHLFEVPSYQI